jgi:hypothetical protein
LQDLTIERQIGDEAFEACVFLAQLAQFADLGRTETAKALTPGVERRYGKTPNSRVMSAIRVLASAWRSAAAICSLE